MRVKVIGPRKSQRLSKVGPQGPRVSPPLADSAQKTSQARGSRWQRPAMTSVARGGASVAGRPPNFQGSFVASLPIRSRWWWCRTTPAKARGGGNSELRRIASFKRSLPATPYSDGRDSCGDGLVSSSSSKPRWSRSATLPENRCGGEIELAAAADLGRRLRPRPATI